MPQRWSTKASRIALQASLLECVEALDEAVESVEVAETAAEQKASWPAVLGSPQTFAAIGGAVKVLEIVLEILLEMAMVECARVAP